MSEGLSKFIGKEDYSISELPMFKEFINNITNEELGVLQSKIDENYYVLWRSSSGFLIMTGNINKARRIKRKEAEQFPQFKWVPLTDF